MQPWFVQKLRPCKQASGAEYLVRIWVTRSVKCEVLTRSDEEVLSLKTFTWNTPFPPPHPHYKKCGRLRLEWTLGTL
jgi:hypothetical protein